VNTTGNTLRWLVRIGCCLFLFGAGAAAARAQSEEWFRSDAGRQAVENVLSWQADAGDWPKNQDNQTTPFRGERSKLKGTFDNGATTKELHFLARAFSVTKDARCEAAFRKGLRHILDAQYPNGGWPQFHPPPAKSYHRHITFNDGTMVRLLELLRDVATKAEFEFAGKETREKSQRAFERGIECILKCQVVVDGVRTVWCAQHDEVTLEPRPGRAFELVSLSGAESAGILRLLMSLDRPSLEVRRAVDSGVEWFRTVKIVGLRETRVEGNKVMVNDAAAPVLWARFYEIGTNRPFFAGRDGVKKFSIGEIESERRNGYAWYGSFGESVMRDHQKWRSRLDTLR
jgi:PelA/Pel-15E family pectate lyase